MRPLIHKHRMVCFPLECALSSSGHAGETMASAKFRAMMITKAVVFDDSDMLDAVERCHAETLNK